MAELVFLGEEDKCKNLKHLGVARGLINMPVHGCTTEGASLAKKTEEGELICPWAGNPFKQLECSKYSKPEFTKK